jgi:hypothetical protein
MNKLPLSGAVCACMHHLLIPGLSNTVTAGFSKFGKLIVASILLFSIVDANAMPLLSNTDVVSSPTNTATFDSITSSGINLDGYTEDGIEVSVPDISYVGFTYIGFDAFNTGSRSTALHYGSGGNTSYVTISMMDGSLIFGLDFLLGDGWVDSITTNLIWETFNGTTSTGFGDVVLNKGTTVGWTDNSGFSSLRVAANDPNINAFGEFQTIAIDDLDISTASVPEPSTLALLSLGLAGLGFKRRRMQA